MVTFKTKYASTPDFINVWVAWNVGQGQWVTQILSDDCHHYDIGGEVGSFKAVKKTLLSHCGSKTNKLHLSHWDYDHFLNLPSFAKAVPKLCWQNLPEFMHTKKLAKKILALNIPHCQLLLHGQNNNPELWIPFTARNTNESSIIFYNNNVLITGDSPIQKEKLWVQEFLDIALTRVLILGHHGSRTSTGKTLLSSLPQLKFSIASSRYAKYGHPHKDVLNRLRGFKIPLLKTEDWGNIWFE